MYEYILHNGLSERFKQLILSYLSFGREAAFIWYLQHPPQKLQKRQHNVNYCSDQPRVFLADGRDYVVKRSIYE